MSKLSIQHWLRRTYVSAFSIQHSALSPFLYKECSLVSVSRFLRHLPFAKNMLSFLKETLPPHQVSLAPRQVSLPPHQVSLAPRQLSLPPHQVSLSYTQQLKKATYNFTYI